MSGFLRDVLQDNAPSAAVAFSKRMQLVEPTEVLRQRLREILNRLLSQVIVSREVLKKFVTLPLNQVPRSKIRRFLVNVDDSDLSGPLIDVLKQMMVNRLE